jgi:hypothetical protein
MKRAQFQGEQSVNGESEARAYKTSNQHLPLFLFGLWSMVFYLGLLGCAPLSLIFCFHLVPFELFFAANC